MVKKVSEAEKVAVDVAAEEGKGLAKVITDSAAEACTAASNAIPAASKLARKAVYNGFYFASYGIIYSAMVVGSLVPSNNAMGEGVHDGATAARRDFAARKDGGLSVAGTAAAAT